MANANRMIALGLPPALANEIAAQIAESGGGSVQWANVQNKPASFPTNSAAISDAQPVGRSVLTAADAAAARSAMGAQFTLVAPTQAEMEAGTSVVHKALTALGVAQGINARTRSATMPALTTAGGTNIPQGTLQQQLQTIANLANPS